MKYYNGDKILNKKQPINFVLGNRSAGKSFYWKRYCIKRFLEHGEQFIYIRRYKSDLDCVIDTFFNDVSHKFPKHDFEVKGNEFYIDNMIAGYGIPVSSFSKYKSVMFDKVTTLMFDEFIPENGRYIGGKDKPFLEVETCLNFYQSVARGYNKPIRDDVRFIFISNTVTLNNQYFWFFGIDKQLKPDTKFINGKGYCLEITLNTEISDTVKSSTFGKAIADSSYDKYANGNSFYLDDNTFIEKMAGKGEYYYNILSDGVLYAVYRFLNEGFWYITDKGVNKDVYTYALTIKDQGVNHIGLYAFRSKIKPLQNAYAFGCVRFNNQRSKNMFERVIL